jgi:hypothetical protein
MQDTEEEAKGNEEGEFDETAQLKCMLPGTESARKSRKRTKQVRRIFFSERRKGTISST